MPSSIKKFEIINKLISEFSLTSYFEYNKFDGALAFEDVICIEKSIAFIPENSFLNKDITKRIINVAKDYPTESIVPPNELHAHCPGKLFDIIFFDPVHIRPQVDYTLKKLISLLKPSGFLVIHDCCPKKESITGAPRNGRSEWVGDTYKAFALLRHFNPLKSLVVDEDYGVAVIINDNLNTHYPIEFDIDYTDISQNRRAYLGLMTYKEFIQRLSTNSRANLFSELPRMSELRLKKSNNSTAATESDSALTNAQLFWSIDGANYTEQHSITLPIRQDGTLQTLRFYFNDLHKLITDLRFDFADCEASAELESVVLLDAGGGGRWEWAGELNFFSSSNGVRIFNITNDSPHKIMIATNSDPQFSLNIPREIYPEITDGWIVQIKLRPQPKIIHALLASAFGLKDNVK